MNRFLVLSGIIFWITVFILIVIGVYYGFQFSKYSDEIKDFLDDFEQTIIEENRFEQKEIYFTKEYMKKSTSRGLEDAFDVFGQYENCQRGDFEITVREDPRGFSADGVMNCEFSRWDAIFELKIVKINDKWQVDFFRMTSDGFKMAL